MGPRAESPDSSHLRSNSANGRPSVALAGPVKSDRRHLLKRSYYSPPEKRLKGSAFESENPRGSSGPSGIPRDFAARLVVEVYATELAAPPHKEIETTPSGSLLLSVATMQLESTNFCARRLLTPPSTSRGAGRFRSLADLGHGEVGIGPAEALVAGDSIRIPL